MFGIYSNTLDLYSIYYFSENDIWVTDICSPIHWDGNEWTLYHIQNLGLDACAGNAIWGTSSSNMYFVGLEGSIVHYDGSCFRKIESGSEIPIIAVSGNSSDNIYFCHYDYWLGPSRILHYNGSEFVEIFASETSISDSDVLAGNVQTLWVSSTSLYASCSSGIWQETFQGGIGTMTKWEEIHGGVMHSNNIDGQADNDIFVAGNRLRIIHYNGSNWMSYSNNFSREGVFESVSLKNNVVCAVGWLPYSGAIVVKGKRN